MVIIEEPEVHLHPDLECMIADIQLFKALQDNSSPMLIIETPSEHFLLRLMKRIKQSTMNKLPNNLPPLDPKNINVYFVKQKNGASSIKSISLDKEGEIKGGWPIGFFDQAMKERLDDDSKITPSKFKIFNEQTVGKNNFKPDLMYIDDSLSPKQKIRFLKIYGEDGYRFAFDVNASMKQIYKEEMDKAKKLI